MGDVASAPRTARRRARAARRPRARRVRDAPPDPGRIPPGRALRLPAAGFPLRLRHHRPALREPVRQLGRRPARARRAPGARGRLRRRAAPRARARARHPSLRVDAGRHAPALASLEDVAARGGHRCHRRRCERRRHVVAEPLRHARRAAIAERLRRRGRRRARLRALRARGRRARRAPVPAQRRRDDRDARHVRVDAADRHVLRAAVRSSRRSIASSSAPTRSRRRADGC